MRSAQLVDGGRAGLTQPPAAAGSALPCHKRAALCCCAGGGRRSVDEGVRGALTSVTRGWRVLNNPWLPEDEEDVQEYAYVDLQLNVEKYTGETYTRGLRHGVGRRQQRGAWCQTSFVRQAAARGTPRDRVAGQYTRAVAAATPGCVWRQRAWCRRARSGAFGGSLLAQGTRARTRGASGPPSTTSQRSKRRRPWPPSSSRRQRRVVAAAATRRAWRVSSRCCTGWSAACTRPSPRASCPTFTTRTRVRLLAAGLRTCKGRPQGADGASGCAGEGCGRQAGGREAACARRRPRPCCAPWRAAAGTWGANLPFFKARFASPSSKPHLENLYFTLLFVLRAVTKVRVRAH